jgi:hypothetical protein
VRGVAHGGNILILEKPVIAGFLMARKLRQAGLHAAADTLLSQLATAFTAMGARQLLRSLLGSWSTCPADALLQKKNSLPPVNWRWVEEGDGYVGRLQPPGHT